jgi:hypothetical protein
MTGRRKIEHDEVYCDFNARMTMNGYSLERRGSIEDLRNLGLTLEAAVGRHFTFVMDDANDDGTPNDIMFNGTVVHDPKWGYLAVEDEHGFFWRSDTDDSAGA